MLDPFRADIGPYSMLLPGRATVVAAASRTPDDAFQMATTAWTVSLGRFQIFVHLDARAEPAYLKEFIDWQTRGDVMLDHISVNDIPGVRYGDYGPPRTRIDWWFKRGDTMICLCLQSVELPFTAPSEGERAEHEQIIGLLKYIPDNPAESAPLPSQVRLRTIAD